MSSSGSREGFGSPPWDPADPVQELEDTQALPGLGNPGVRRSPGQDTGPGTGSGRNGSASTQGRASTPGAPGTPGTDDHLARDLPIRNTAARHGAAHDGAPGQPGGPGAPGAPSQPDPQGPNGPNGPYGTQAPYGSPGSDAPGPPGDQDGHDEQADQPPGQPGQPARKRRRRRSLARELPVLIVVALVLALLIKTYAIQAFFIPSSSMEQTLDIGDRVLINKLVYDFRGIHRGDIVVFDGDGSWDYPAPAGSSNIFSRFFGDVEGIVGISHDSDIYIKRVIGLPGDHVVCCDSSGRVTVNGVALNEKSYVYPGEVPSASRFNITVPPGRLWVMGDHRAVSFDSRGHMGYPGGGTIPESAVLGRAFVIIWPPSRWTFLDIPATFEQPKLNASTAAAGGSRTVLAAAMDNGTPLQPATSGLPLAFGFAGAVPLTWLQALARRKFLARRGRRER